MCSYLQVPFIAFYRKEYVEPELNINDLWKVYQWDEKVCVLTCARVWLNVNIGYLDGHIYMVKGLCKEFFFQKSEITMEVGGWVGPGLTRIFFFWKIFQK